MISWHHNHSQRFSIAPMMDWTDRHCRYLHRQLTRHALLFTEMLTSGAVVHGDRERFLGYDPAEHPVAFQLGGSNPEELAEATRIVTDFGYDEINLNVGCPSDRVKSGRFGACLMAEPRLVADCVAAMKAVTDVPVTVKCRIGIDDQDPEPALDTLADAVIDAGANLIYVHARKAWLQGLSPKENRDVPPLDYGRVYRLAERLKPFPIAINGGIETVADARVHLEKTAGVMMGRAAYHNPMLLAEVDREIFDDLRAAPDIGRVMDAMTDYAGRELKAGVRLNMITRHMLGLAAGQPGARRFRQILSVEATRPGAGPEIIPAAFAALDRSDASPSLETA
jgi:tRNA-dihydrouridine synthase A